MENATRDDRITVTRRDIRGAAGDEAGADGPEHSLRRLRRGDQREFDRLYRRHHQEIYRYRLAILRSPEDAEDALQATMAAALRSPRGGADIDLRPWLFRVAHNESISAMRRRRTDAELIEAEDPDRRLCRGRGQGAGSGCASSSPTCANCPNAALGPRHEGAERPLLRGNRRRARQRRGSGLHEARTALSDLAEGREMECEEIRTPISARDGRRLRAAASGRTCVGATGAWPFAGGGSSNAAPTCRRSARRYRRSPPPRS